MVSAVTCHHFCFLLLTWLASTWSPMIYEKHSKHLEASIWLSIELPAYHHCNVFSTQNGFTRWFCLLHVMFQVCIITLFCSLSYMNWVNSEVTLCQNHSIILYLPNIYVARHLSPLRAMEHQTLQGQICLLFIDSKIQSRKPWKLCMLSEICGRQS